MKLLSRLFMGSILLVSACATPVVAPSLDPSLTMLDEAIDESTTSQLLFVNLKINPDIELVVDPDNQVIAVINKNEDAAILTADLDLIGLDVAAATALIIEEAIAAGYLPEDTESLIEVTYSVTGEDETEVDALEDDVEQSIMASIENKAILAIARNRKIVDDTLIEAAALAGLSVDEYLLKVLGDTIGYEFNEDLNYGQNVSALVRLLNDIRQDKEPTQARIRTIQRVQEKVKVMLEANQRLIVKAEADATAAIAEINQIKTMDMSGLSVQEKAQIMAQLETMLQAELQLRTAAQRAINFAI